MQPDHLKNLATAITKRLVENAIRLQFSRNDLESCQEEVTEDEMVQDALNLALGEDTGCLGEEEINATNIDVLFVEEILRKLENNMRDRCFHSFVLVLEGMTARGATAERALNAILRVNPNNLGEGPCNCNRATCPFK